MADNPSTGPQELTRTGRRPRVVGGVLVCAAVCLVMLPAACGGSSAPHAATSANALSRRVIAATLQAPIFVSVQHESQGTQVDTVDRPAGFFVETLNGTVTQLITKSATYTRSTGSSCYTKSGPMPLVDFNANFVPTAGFRYQATSPGPGRLDWEVSMSGGGLSIDVTYDRHYRVTTEIDPGHGRLSTVSYPSSVPVPPAPGSLCG